MRLEKLDILRGLSILLMVIFHLNYSLVNFFGIQIMNFSEIFWLIIWKLSAIWFIIISWISFFLAEKKYWNKILKKYLKVSFVLWILALIISLSTFLLVPEQYIRFWIIHFFAMSFLLMLAFRYLKYYNLLFSVLIIIFWFYFTSVFQSELLYFLWFTYPWFKSADFYPILPYFWFMLIWYVLALFLWDKNKLDLLKLKSKEIVINTFLTYIWNKSLIIYIVHQPIIIGFIYIIIEIKKFVL